LLDIRHQSTIADYFVICSGESERQLQAVVEHIDETIQREFGLNPRIEGTARSGWIVLDYQDVVVHVLSAALREYYQIERLWGQASPVVVFQ